MQINVNNVKQTGGKSTKIKKNIYIKLGQKISRTLSQIYGDKGDS